MLEIDLPAERAISESLDARDPAVPTTPYCPSIE